MAAYLNVFNMWKAGQLVTIKGNIFRVTKVRNNLGIVACTLVCDIHKRYAGTNGKFVPDICDEICYTEGIPKLGDGLFLKLIKPSVSGK